MMFSFSTMPNNFQLWQYKLLLANFESISQYEVLPKQFTEKVREQVEEKLKFCEYTMATDLQKFLSGRLDELDSKISKKMAAFTALFDVPHKVINLSCDAVS